VTAVVEVDAAAAGVAAAANRARGQEWGRSWKRAVAQRAQPSSCLTKAWRARQRKEANATVLFAIEARELKNAAR